MNILDKIDGLEAKFHEVSLLITDPSVIADQARYVRLNRDYHDLERVLECAHRYKKAVTDLQDAKDLFYNESDPEMKEIAKAEIDDLEPQIPKLEEELKLQPQINRVPFLKSIQMIFRICFAKLEEQHLYRLIQDVSLIVLYVIPIYISIHLFSKLDTEGTPAIRYRL